MIVKRVNGQNVSTLSDFRKHFSPKDAEWELETDDGVLYSVDFRGELQNQQARATADERSRYLLTPAVKALMVQRDNQTANESGIQAAVGEAKEALRAMGEVALHSASPATSAAAKR